MWSSILHSVHFSSSRPVLRQLASLSVAGRLLHTSAQINMAAPSKKLMVRSLACIHVALPSSVNKDAILYVVQAIEACTEYHVVHRYMYAIAR